MKSYLRFLSRNKLYTAIEVAGLSVALAFVLLGNVVLDDLSCDNRIRNTDDIYLVLPDDSKFYRPDPEVVFPQVPEIEDWCKAVIHTAYDGKTQYIQTLSGNQKIDITPVLIRGNYFDFFGIELKYGDPKSVMELKNAAVISEEVANVMFPDQNPVGQTLIINEHRLKDVQLIVTGVYKDMGKTILQDRGMFLNMEYINDIDNTMYPAHIKMRLGRPSSIHYVKLSEGADLGKISRFLFENNDTAVHKVFGCSNAKVFWQMVKGFLIPVLAGAVIAIPLAYSYIDSWLSGYPVRIGNTAWIYLLALLIVLAVVIISISFQAVRLMRTNPAETLKKE